MLVLSNDVGNALSSVVTVLPMTSKPKKLNLPSHTWIEQITTIDQKQLVYRMAVCTDKDVIEQIEHSVEAYLGMEKT